MSEQRSAEIIAGIRAEVLPLPESRSLATPFWRAFARFLLRMPGAKSAFAAPAVRQACMTHLMQRHMPPPPQPAKVVECGAGFTARGFHLARAYPHAQIVEIDRPAVLAAKQARLRRTNIVVPPNLTWHGADLAITPLRAVLKGQRADVVVAEGVLMYYPPDVITQIAASVYECLAPDGVFVADLLYRQGLREVAVTHPLVAPLIMRLVGAFRGVFDTPGDAQELFTQAGYVAAEVYRLPTLAAELGLPSAVPDALLLIAARR